MVEPSTSHEPMWILIDEESDESDSERNAKEDDLKQENASPKQENAKVVNRKQKTAKVNSPIQENAKEDSPIRETPKMDSSRKINFKGFNSEGEVRVLTFLKRVFVTERKQQDVLSEDSYYSDSSCDGELSNASLSDKDHEDGDVSPMVYFARMALTPASKLLFRNRNLEPMTFVLMLNDYSLELKVARAITERGGIVYPTARESDIYSIVIVKDNSLYRAHLGPAFKLSYVKKCLEKKRIINISPFVQTLNNAPPVHEFDYMQVVYYKKCSWRQVPECVMMNSSCGERKPVPDEMDVTIIESSDDESPSVSLELPSTSKKAFELPSASKKASEQPSTSKKLSEQPSTSKKSSSKTVIKVNKNSRLPYRTVEDHDIVKYIVKHSEYDFVKGVRLWKDMEKRNVCPNRTWQSMKEHFLKKILYQTDDYNILNREQKHKFRKLLTK